MPHNLCDLTLTEYIRGLKTAQFTASEVQQSLHAAIAEHNPQLNAYLSTAHEEATVNLDSPLAGVPLAVKDNVLIPGFPATAASQVLAGYQPHYEATHITQLKTAGATILGKTNLDAWAHGSSTETSDFGPTKNPCNAEYIPGGSSGGTAAAVAANLTIAGIGTETAGSIRQPASWCGVVGVKPTYGRVSRAGVVAMGSSLDCPGPMTKTVEDGAILLSYMAGHDKYDGTTSNLSVPDYQQSVRAGIKGRKIGLIYLDVVEDPAIRAAYEAVIPVFESLGASVEIATAMDPHYAIGVYTVVMRAEVSSNLARYDGLRYGQDRSHFGDEAKRRIMLGTYTLAKGYAEKYYLRAQQVRTKYIQDYARLFSQYDLLIAPSTPGFALKLGESKKHPFFGEMIDLLIEPCSLSGLPGINVPCYRDTQTNLPVGLNIMAPAFQEELMFQAAYAYEQATDWNPWINRQRGEI